MTNFAIATVCVRSFPPGFSMKGNTFCSTFTYGLTCDAVAAPGSRFSISATS